MPVPDSQQDYYISKTYNIPDLIEVFPGSSQSFGPKKKKYCQIQEHRDVIPGAE